MKTETAEPRVVCAWCGSTVRDGQEPVSHGICEKCENELNKEIELLLENENGS